MPSFCEQETSPYSPLQMYALVADVARYPEFLPWCRAARILERTDNGFLAELMIAFKAFRECYTSRVVLHPPAGEHAAAAIEVDMVRGPFKYLRNHWRFLPTENGTDIQLELDFAFNSRILEAAAGQAFRRAAEKMAYAFKERADALYGENTSTAR